MLDRCFCESTLFGCCWSCCASIRRRRRKHPPPPPTTTGKMMNILEGYWVFSWVRFLRQRRDQQEDPDSFDRRRSRKSSTNLRNSINFLGGVEQDDLRGSLWERSAARASATSAIVPVLSTNIPDEYGSSLVQSWTSFVYNHEKRFFIVMIYSRSSLINSEEQQVIAWQGHKIKS